MTTYTDDYLEHHGVKGMKWGVKRPDVKTSGGAMTRKEKRVAKDNEIEGARNRQRERTVALERQAFKTYSANGEKAAKAALAKYDRMEAETLNHPDAKTADKMLHGEKVAAGIVLGVYGVAVAGIMTVTTLASR